MNNYIGTVFLGLALLFLAGGVIGQLDQGPRSDPAVQRGMDYLSAQPNLDGGALLTLSLINQRHPEYGLDSTISRDLALLDDFHYPLRQFLSNQPIDSHRISDETIQAPYYADFIHYFSCDPLTPEWVDSLRGLSDDGSEFGAYNASHSLLLLQLLKNDYVGGRCGNFQDMALQIDSAIQQKSAELESDLGDREDFDSWVEKIAVLEYAGQPIPEDARPYIESQQLPNGGWKQASWINGDSSADDHSTALAVWALTEARP